VQGAKPIAPALGHRLKASGRRHAINAGTASSQSDFVRRRANDDRARLAAAIAAAGRGDKDAFEDVYRRTSAKLFGVCLRIFPERQDAEDALQDAFVTIWSKAATFDSARASPITWLVTLTRNRAIDRLRQMRNRGLAGLDEAAEIADPAPLAEAALLSQEADSRLSFCINSLESRDAECVRTAFLQGATYAELAQRDDVPLGTVKSRIRRALLKLRACMNQ
jgi:RNA polymerase sigma-70 factor, ECF subfamily